MILQQLPITMFFSRKSPLHHRLWRAAESGQRDKVRNCEIRASHNVAKLVLTIKMIISKHYHRYLKENVQIFKKNVYSILQY